VREFLANNRDELIARCKLKVSLRPRRAATDEQLANGVPMFLAQLTRTLLAEESDESEEGLRISGPSGGDALELSEIGLTAAAHGRDLLRLGYTVDQVVHDYGDLCQAITELAFERDAPFEVKEFRTLNRCLDNAIADAVTEFSFQRDLQVTEKHSFDEALRLGELVHELRNALTTANLSVRALELGNMPMAGATGAVLKRSLASLGSLITRSMEAVRVAAQMKLQVFSVADLIADAAGAAGLDGANAGCTLAVPPVDPLLGISGNRELLLGALSNLLQNAFKFTHFHTEITLLARGFGQHVLIEVKDHCGGLPQGLAEKLFTPFVQSGRDKSGIGLGLSIARNSVEADGGTLTVQDVPGTGCIFTIRLPRFPLPSA
jgi:signal transduction histidine kinase